MFSCRGSCSPRLLVGAPIHQGTRTTSERERTDNAIPGCLLRTFDDARGDSTVQNLQQAVAPYSHVRHCLEHLALAEGGDDAACYENILHVFDLC